MMTALRCWFAAAACATAAAASAAQIEYDEAGAMQRQQIRQYEIELMICLRQAVQIPLSQGVRDSDQITAWAAMLCGPGYAHYFVNTLKRSPAAVDAHLKAQAEDALRRTPGVSLPTSPAGAAPAPAPKR